MLAVQIRRLKPRMPPVSHSGMVGAIQGFACTDCLPLRGKIPMTVLLRPGHSVVYCQLVGVGALCSGSHTVKSGCQSGFLSF